MTPTAKEKLACVIRELSYRRRVYPRLVADNRMTPHGAQAEIALMEAIEQDYRDLVEAEQPEFSLNIETTKTLKQR